MATPCRCQVSSSDAATMLQPCTSLSSASLASPLLSPSPSSSSSANATPTGHPATPATPTAPPTHPLISTLRSDPSPSSKRLRSRTTVGPFIPSNAKAIRDIAESPDFPGSLEERHAFMVQYRKTGQWRRPATCEHLVAHEPVHSQTDSSRTTPRKAAAAKVTTSNNGTVSAPSASASAASSSSPSHRSASSSPSPLSPSSSALRRQTVRPRPHRSNTCDASLAPTDNLVRCPETGDLMDTMGYFDRHGYLPAPLPPSRIRRARRVALRRHGFTKPGLRPTLARYVRHARQVFDAAFARIVTPSTEDDSILLGVSEDGTFDVVGVEDFHCCRYSLNWSETICAHAMLLHTKQVFVVNDLQEDWRFSGNPAVKRPGGGPRFYASAPLLVTIPESPRGEKIEIGRLSILGMEPRESFGEDKALLLADIAAMACETLEHELQTRLAERAALMQEAASQMSDALWRTSYDEMISTTAPHQKQAELACEMITRCLPASAAIIDVSAYRLSTLHSGSKLQRGASTRSPGSSSFYPHTPWLDAASPRSSGISLEGGALTPSIFSELSTASSSSSSGLTTAASQSSLTSSPGHHHSRSTSYSKTSRMQVEDDYVAQIDPAHSPTVFAHDGDLPPMSLDKEEARSTIGSFLAEWRRDLIHPTTSIFSPTRGPYLTPSHMSPGASSPSEDSETDEPSAPLTADRNSKSPLGALFADSPETAMYLAMPICQDHSDPQVTFLLLVYFPSIYIMEPPDHSFLKAVCRLLIGGLMRQHVRLADKAQLDFVRGVQHEMRTPINGISGITELLRSSVASGGKDLDTDPDGFLSLGLEGIRLSAGNISSILDDVLDFGDLSGIRSANTHTARLDETDLCTLVEEVGQEEIEIAAIGLRHSVKVSHANVDVRPPDFIVTVDESLKGRFRCDRTSMRKIFRKLLHNSFRFTNRDAVKGATVEVVVRPVSPCGHKPGADHSGQGREILVAFDFIDTGCGMEQEFINSKFLSPFAKGDAFQQGTGLGGAIAAGLSQRLGGNLDVYSEPGHGTRVTVTLPLLHIPESQQLPNDERPERFIPACKMSKAFFAGFQDTLGERKTKALLASHLSTHGVTVVDSGDEADLLIVHDYVLSSSAGPSTEQLIPPLTSRVVVVTPDPLQRTTKFEAIRSLPFHLFRPPFGPGSLAALDEFLQDSHPIVLLPLPSLPGAAEMQQDASLDEPSVDVRPSSTTPQALYTPSDPVAATEEPDTANALRAANGTSTLGDNPDPVAVATGPAPPESGFRCLAVEDNPTNMKILTVVLQREGIEYYEARDGAEAMEQYKKHQPHLVLLDISLPIADGFEVCEYMRSADAAFGHRPRIVAVTALSSKEDQKRGLAMGMDEWHTKPMAPRVLTKCLKAWKAEWELERRTLLAAAAHDVQDGSVGPAASESTDLTNSDEAPVDPPTVSSAAEEDHTGHTEAAIPEDEADDSAAG